MGNPTFPCESCGTFHSASEVSAAGGYCPQCDADYDERKMFSDLVSRYATLEAENDKLRAELERRAVPEGWKLAVDNVAGYAHLFNSGSGIIHEISAEHARLLAAAPSAPKADERPLYTCIGKGGEYRYLGTAIGAGDSRGELIEVYQDRSGQLYHRTPEDFMERMEPVAASITAARQEGWKV